MSLATGDLTTLATAKQYMDSPPSDAILSGLITRISRSILTILNRQMFVPFTYVQQFNGTGTTSLVLPYWPVLSLTSLMVDGISFDEAPQPSDSVGINSLYGWRFVPWNGLPPGTAANIELVGSRFCRGLQNVVVEYAAGYRVTNESQTVPNDPGPYQIIPLAPYGIWATDEGVAYVDGTELTAVSSNPQEGEYVPPDPSLSTPIGYYTFSAADAGATILLSYGFIPADVEQVAIELISERAVYRRRVGVKSQMLASQETIVYDTSGMTRYVREMLNQYVSPIPTMTGANV